MGLFDIFKKKDQPAEPAHDPADDFDTTPSKDITIDVDEEHITINGKKLALPINMNELVELFGKPEKQTFGKVYVDVLDDDDNAFLNAMVGQRINYVWNDLGLYAYTDDRVNVNTLMLVIRPYEDHEMPEIFPKNMFGGTFTINGGSWFPPLKPIKTEYSNSAEKKMRLGRHLIYANFTSRDFKDKNRTERHYSGFQITLPSE